MTRLVIAAAAAILLLAGTGSLATESSPSPSASPRLLTLADYESIKSPAGANISRDGKWVAYVLEDQVYVVPTDGGAARAVTGAGSSAWEPYWSKDGSLLYFLSDRSGSSQVWKLQLGTFGEAEQVTTLEHGIGELNFSPDESWLLLRFTAEELKEAETQAEDGEQTAEKPEEKVARDDSSEEEDSPKPFVVTRLYFKEDSGEGYLTGDLAKHLYSFDLASRKLTQLTSGQYSESEARWSPDGRQVVFVSNREKEPDASDKTDLWLVASDNTDKGQSLVRLTADDRVKSEPAWSPDGKTIAFLSAEDGVYGIPHLAVMPASGGEPRILTAGLDRWINDFRYAPDGQWIYFTYEHEGSVRIARVRPATGKLEPVAEGEQFIGEFDVAANGAIAASVEVTNRGMEIYSIAKVRATPLTRANDEFHNTVALGVKETVSFKSADGTVVQAFVTKPPGFETGRKYPTILNIHGGPVGQFSWGYNFDAQYFAANGYVVVEPNPRGSTGHGQDFVKAIHHAWGESDYEDVIAAVDHMIAAGYADPELLAVTGYSYGGYMTNVVITRTDRFKAAASGAGQSDIAANYGHDIYLKTYNWEPGPPWENREKYDRLSPLLQAGKVTTPTIFLGGRDDWNMPILNAELFYQSLRQRGIDTQLVVYPGTHHGDWSAEFDTDYYNRVREWFDKYLK